MLDLKTIRENPVKIKEGVSAKLHKLDVDSLLEKDQEKRNLLQEVEVLKQERNQASEEISQAKRSGADAEEKIAAMKAVSQKISDLDGKLAEIDQEISKIMLSIPNIPHETVPKGGASENKVVSEWGKKPAFDFKPKDHIELGENLSYFEFKTASKITGSGFSLLKGSGAKLERALIQFMLDYHIQNHGYTELAPPYIVNAASMMGTGQLPNLAEDMYKIEGEDQYLIPTAEVPVTNFYRDELLNEEDLPIKFVAYSACFRKEAGSYGKDTKGLTRLHQFNKVELVKFAHPDNSYEEIESLRENAEAILRVLGLSYRVLLLASGDTSFSAAKCYDLEVWSPATEKYLEVSSCSNFEDFQARRANIRFKGKTDKKPRFVHTLNASGLALPRLMIAIMENYQKADGTIQYPDILKPYLF